MGRRLDCSGTSPGVMEAVDLVHPGRRQMGVVGWRTFKVRGAELFEHHAGCRFCPVHSLALFSESTCELVQTGVVAGYVGRGMSPVSVLLDSGLRT
ncbi:hypothetical protein RR46_00738 [Papilio xuthus]|uniref:Uncharacterized protein n=1 Tax=Papilio xuthus TaxID=66420 RepID=A0A0N1INE7_PAPXU|nr:hypothetical protein RR46_00738 [Papilio xuthus]